MLAWVISSSRVAASDWLLTSRLEDFVEAAVPARVEASREAIAMDVVRSARRRRVYAGICFSPSGSRDYVSESTPTSSLAPRAPVLHLAPVYAGRGARGRARAALVAGVPGCD